MIFPAWRLQGTPAWKSGDDAAGDNGTSRAAPLFRTLRLLTATFQGKMVSNHLPRVCLASGRA